MDPVFLAADPFSAQPQDIRLGRLILASYAQGFGPQPKPVGDLLFALGMRLVDVILSHDDIEPQVCYGLIAQDLKTGDLYEAWRGTQDEDEWIGNAEFWPRPCSWAPQGTKLEHGFGCVIDNAVTLMGTPIANYPIKAVVGHSKGAAVAAGRAAKVGAEYAGLWASPRLWNQAGVDWLKTRVRRIFRPFNDGDRVPGVPFDLPPFFQYSHPPGFQIDSAAFAKTDIGCRHQLRTYLHFFDPSVTLDAGCVSNG